MQLLKGCFPDVVVKAEKNKQQSWLCVTAFVSISTHFFGISAGGVILFFFHAGNFPERVIHFSHPHFWLTHFLPGAKTTILEPVPTLTRRDSSATVNAANGWSSVVIKQRLPGCSHGSVYNVEEGTDASVHSPFGQWYRNISSPAAWSS